jgi:hypothetical protein
MILTCTHPAPPERRERRDTPIFEGFRTDYIVTPGPAALTPQAFLVEQDPLFHLSTHYHLQHQFQVVVSGEGTLGKHAITPFSTHYASPESGYGPIIAGTSGLSYFTLRVVADSTTWVLPEHRASMRHGLAKRQRFAPAPHRTEGPPASRGIDAVLPLDPHGTGAWFVRLPPQDSIVLPSPELGAGRFHIVSSGSMTVGAQPCGPNSVVFTSSNETAFPITAGEGGLELMVVQFPADALP